MNNTANNKLIAEFMGAKDGNPVGSKKTMINVPDFFSKRTTSTHYLTDLKYNERWDWLKPVINKIKGLEKDWPMATDGVCSLLLTVDINTAYNEVVTFVKWYTSQAAARQGEAEPKQKTA